MCGRASGLNHRVNLCTSLRLTHVVVAVPWSSWADPQPISESHRRLFPRHCPGHAPEEISVERAETDAPPPRAPFASFGGEGSPHDFFAQVESMLSGFGFGGLGVPLLPPRRAPPDRAREPPPPRVKLQVDEV